MAADLGWVALHRAQLSLAGRIGGVARSAWRDAEFLLAERAAFLLLLLCDLRRLGGWEGAPEGVGGPEGGWGRLGVKEGVDVGMLIIRWAGGAVILSSS